MKRSNEIPGSGMERNKRANAIVPQLNLSQTIHLLCGPAE
jgi:hypothetical protein